MELFDEIGFGGFRWMLRKRCEGVWIGRVCSAFKVKVQGQGVCCKKKVSLRSGTDVQSQVVAAGLDQPPR